MHCIGTDEKTKEQINTFEPSNRLVKPDQGDYR